MRPGAVKEILTGPGAAAAVSAAAHRIASAAGPGMETRPLERGRNRVRMAVYTATWQAKHAEATTRALTRAVDAGRG
jgi:hypothetical protein